MGYQANGAPVSYRANGPPVSYQANGPPIGYQGYDPSIGYQSYANDDSGPISMHTGSHHHNSDVSSIFATKYWWVVLPIHFFF